MSLGNVVVWWTVSSWRRKVARRRNLQFSNRQLQISARVDMGVQDLNFVHKFPENMWFPEPFLFVDELADK